LDDAKTVAEFGVVEKGFIVCMLAKPRAAAASAPPANAAAAPAPAAPAPFAAAPAAPTMQQFGGMDAAGEYGDEDDEDYEEGDEGEEGEEGYEQVRSGLPQDPTTGTACV
jgi:hypothetical protein